ncbi:MAG: NAD(P)H-hydrate dehydratase, partial [Alphaproteobacteria bacterium]|nr:NAD(P)H-hydrate dehydratase [Alphaproteobacteria bacterium]
TRPTLKFFLKKPLSGLFSFAYTASIPEGEQKTVQTGGKSHILLTPEESRKADAWAIDNGTNGLTLMEAAGKAVAEVICDYIGTPLETGGEIVILCGPGNNGGDGFVAGRYLEEWGYPVRIMLSVQAKELKGDAAIMARRWQGGISSLDAKRLAGASVIVDALFGTGLKREIEGVAADAIAAANQMDVFRVAIDVPSGLDAESGLPLGPCFSADATITFFTKKPGHVMVPGRFLCGGNENIHVADIGISVKSFEAIGPHLFENSPALWGSFYPFPGPETHKYHRGHMLVLGGKEPTLGACRLAAMAGLRVGAGLVTLAAPSETYNIQATALTDVMVRRFDSAFGFLGIMSDTRINTILLGPGAGVGEKTAELVHDAVGRKKAAVLDADALSSLVGRLEMLTQEGNDNIVLTPHEGEFARLFPGLSKTTDKISAARSAAVSSKCHVVLKGVSTVVAAPDGRVSVATNAPAWLSVAGTGDVLSGIIAGLIAQGMPTFEAASAGVWLHSEAAMKAGRGLIASDLLKALPSVLL